MNTRNWHQEHKQQQTFGERLSEHMTNGVGSWPFIITQTVIISCWVGGNIYLLFHFDPFPFIFLNLAFSAQAAYATPIIMMGQNAQSKRDKIQAEHQYKHQEKELTLNTELTREVHTLVKNLTEYMTSDKNSKQ